MAKVIFEIYINDIKIHEYSNILESNNVYIIIADYLSQHVEIDKNTANIYTNIKSNNNCKNC